MREPPAAKPIVHVMAGVLQDAEGRVLLAQRPPGKHLAGMWEFPGGKREPGESPHEALVRELHEELGIVVQRSRPLIRVPCHYPERELLLDTWRIHQWGGTAQPLEGQPLEWLALGQIDPANLAPADRAVLQSLQLPTRYAITPPDVALADRGIWFERIGQAIERGEQLIQLRLPLWPRESVRELAQALLTLARRHEARLLLNGDIDGARLLGIGVQLKARQALELAERPLPLSQLVVTSCHDTAQLAEAERIGADFATLSPVAATALYPQSRPIGWPRFRAMAEAAALPVYAAGGLAPSHIAQAIENDAQGVAGTRDFWWP